MEYNEYGCFVKWIRLIIVYFDNCLDVKNKQVNEREYLQVVEDKIIDRIVNYRILCFVCQIIGSYGRFLIKEVL